MVERYDEEMLLGYVEGDLTPDQRARFEQQLMIDARLRNLVAQLLVDRNELRMLPDDVAPPQVMEAVHHRLERDMLLDGTMPAAATSYTVHSFQISRWLGYAAAAALFLIGASLVLVTLIDTAGFESGLSEQQIAMLDTSPLAQQMLKSETAAGEQLPLSKLAANPVAPAPGDTWLSSVAASPPAARVAANDRASESPARPAAPMTVAENELAAARYRAPAAALSQPEPGQAVTTRIERAAVGDQYASLTSSTAVGTEGRVQASGLSDDRTVVAARADEDSMGLVIELTTRDIDAGGRSVLSWAISHRVQANVVMPERVGYTSAVKSLEESDSPAPAAASQLTPRTQRLSVVLPESRIPELLEHLNKQAGVTVRIKRDEPARQSLDLAGARDEAGKQVADHFDAATLWPNVQQTDWSNILQLNLPPHAALQVLSPDVSVTIPVLIKEPAR